MQLFEGIDFKKLGNYSGTRYVFATGVPAHLQQILLEKLKKTLNFNFLYAKSNNSDIQKYIQSTEYITLSGESYTQRALELTLTQNNFTHVFKVSNRGEWNKKGDIVTVWPVEYDHPVRISYFGDEIEYAETYDEVYGNKIGEVDTLVVGDFEKLPDKVDWFEIDLTGEVDVNSKLIVIFSKHHPKLSPNNVIDESKWYVLEFDYNYPTLYYGRFDILEQELERLEQNDWRIYIKSGYPKRLSKKINEFLIDSANGLSELSAGFTSAKYKQLYLTDRELFGRLFLQKERKNLTTKQAQKILEKLEGEVKVDDYIVHEDHGVGIYKGLHQQLMKETHMVNFERIETETLNDYLKIAYAEGDELLIPISQIQKITKYIGTTNDEPEITRLHKGTWKRDFKKAKKSVELIAKDLVEHYARLEMVKIDPMENQDSEFYKDFIKAFPYEETNDQLNAENDVKKDLMLDKPMNRLIVGDVGFGKTEVAMRAAFKIVEDGKQVAVLCPTTVLAAQHHKVFKDRFAEFGIEVSYVSSYKTASENRETVKLAKQGKVEILVGTHRLLSSDIEFKDLGLVIVDEEQKFGVKQKEKIRQLQYGAHSLAMSATPIPRTLSMALSQIQDISIIATAPTERKPVHTEVDKIDWNKVANQLHEEIKRGGQAYFIHNEVRTIHSILHKLSGLLPDTKFVIGHGQMKGLDKVITDFYDRKYDVLIATTIIENGIDMPNVNTIVINNAQNFGLGQLYQLRGRVGRSDKQAFCYLYYKGDDLNAKQQVEEKKSSENKRKYIKRLKAIMEAQELGSGFKLASRDLEIRGAGNLLGKQQHGNITNVGLALYMQMLAEEIERLKNMGKS